MGKIKIKKKLSALSDEELDELIGLIKREIEWRATVYRVFKSPLENDGEDDEEYDGNGVIGNILKRLSMLEYRVNKISPDYTNYEGDNPSFTVTCTL